MASVAAIVDRGGVRDRHWHALAGDPRSQPRRQQQEADHSGEGELPARLPRRARVEHERHRGGQAERVPARRRTPGESGDQAGDRHHAGALDRRAAAGQRDVQRDEEGSRDEPHPQRHVEHRARREHQHAEQEHVLTGYREQMGQAGPPEVLLHVLRDRLVLPEDHAAEERGLGRRQPASQPVRRALADRVEPARDAAARTARGRPAADVDRRVGAAPFLVGVDVTQRRDHATQPQLTADPGAGRSPPVRRTCHGHLAVEPGGGGGRRVCRVRGQGHVADDPHPRDGAAVTPRLQWLQQDRPRVDRPALQPR